MASYSNHFGLTIDDAITALECINPNISYQDWANIGRALATEYGNDAQDAFFRWSEGADSFNRSSVNSQWRSFLRANKVNISTLIYHAKQAGWEPEKTQPLSEFEKKKRDSDRAKTRLAREQKAERAAVRKQRRSAAWYSNLQQVFHGKKASPYQVDKLLDDAANFSEFKEYHSGKRHLQVIPLRDVQGHWRGAELISAWRKTKHPKSGKLRHFKRTMTGTEPALGFHVFPNHEALATAKRVFITEGWADGAWAHKATGEVTAYVVGSHNLPTIAAEIEQAYPDCQVITAADNDKAGLEATQKHAGYWTMPLALNDWSDVASTEGPESLKAQLLNVRGFKKCYVNERYLGNAAGAKIQPGLNLVKSAKETGKSSWIIDFLNQDHGLSVLVVSYRKNLVNQLANKAQVDYYEDLINVDRFGNFSNVELRRSSRLAISPDSLYKLIEKGTVAAYDVVFIDECDQTLMHFDADTMKNKEKNHGVMSWLLKHSKYQILADADLSDITTEYCNDINLSRGQYLINTYKPREGSEINLYMHNMQLRNELVARAADEPIFYCSNSKTRVLEVERLLMAAGIQSQQIEVKGSQPDYAEKLMQAVHSGNSGTQEIQNFIVDINNQVKHLHVLLASPSMGTGVSIDNGHPFKAVFAEFSHRTGTAEQAHQQMARTRGVTEYHVFVDPAVNNFETNPEEIRRVMLDKPEKDSENLFTFDINKGELVAKNELFEKLHCRIRAFRNLNRNCFAFRFIEQAEQEGYNIKTIALDKAAAEMTKDQVDEIRVVLDEELRARIFDDINHPVLSEGDFLAAELGSISVSEESRLKTKVMKNLNLADYARFPSILAPEKLAEIVNELAYMEATSGFVNGIKKLSVLAQSKEIAVLRDIEDRKYAESRAHLKHFTAQRRHELRFLKAIGINEHLEYDGKEWQSKEIKASMRSYLKKYRDEIQAYSGSTITPKTLKDPIRWFCDHLKAMNVPLVAYQKRIDGKQVWFRCVDQDQWNQVTRLVNARVRGLTKFYNGKQQELDKIAVTREALISNNNDCPHVTVTNAHSPYTRRPKAKFEGERDEQNISPSLQQENTILTPFEMFMEEACEPTATKIERLKFARAFPESHVQRFNDGLIGKDELKKWMAYGWSGAFSVAVANVAIAIRSILPKECEPRQEVMARLTADDARKYCVGEFTLKDLADIARGG